MSDIVYQEGLTKVRTPAVRNLFELLRDRALQYTKMQLELPTRIAALREVHEGRAPKLSPRQQRTLNNAARDANAAEGQMRSLLRTIDSESIFIEIALDAEQQDLHGIEAMRESFPPWALAALQDLMAHKQESLRLLQTFTAQTKH